jgi:hypothetical protein
MTTVYEFEVWDINRNDYVRVPWKGRKKTCIRARQGRGGRSSLRRPKKLMTPPSTAMADTIPRRGGSDGDAWRPPRRETFRRRDRQRRQGYADRDRRGNRGTLDAAKSPAAELGSRGGKARAAKMTPERRAEIARKAPLSRWKKVAPVAPAKKEPV